MDGIIDGIANKLEAAKATIVGVAESVKKAWDDFWNSASPSKLMIESGQDIMEGGIIGVTNKMTDFMATMRDAGLNTSGAFIESATNLLPNSPVAGSQSSQTSTTNNYEVNNSFAGSPQITDASQLQYALAGMR